MKQSTTINPYVGQRIRLERKRLGISQETLANDLDISLNYLGEIERGKRTVSLNIAEKLCHYFHLTLDYLYKGIETGTVNEDSSCETDPRREMLLLMELCTDQELQLCLEVMKPLIITWRNALDSTHEHPSAASKDLCSPPKL